MRVTEQVCTEKSVIGIFDTECSHIASRIVKPLSESLTLVTERIILCGNDKRFGQALERRRLYGRYIWVVLLRDIIKVQVKIAPHALCGEQAALSVLPHGEVR